MAVVRVRRGRKRKDRRAMVEKVVFLIAQFKYRYLIMCKSSCYL